MAKKYATKEQKIILEDAGILYKKGRTKDEADKIIKILIEKGQVEKNILTRATEKQIIFLTSKGVEIPNNFTKEQATEKIYEINMGQDGDEPATKKQLDFLSELGLKPKLNPNKWRVSRTLDYLLSIKCDRCDQIDYENLNNKKCRFCETKIYNWINKPSFFDLNDFNVIPKENIFLEPIDEGMTLFHMNTGFGETKKIDEHDLALSKTEDQIKILRYLNIDINLVNNSGEAKELIDFLIKRTCLKCSKINTESLDSTRCLECNGYLKKIKTIPNFFKENIVKAELDENFIPATVNQIDALEDMGISLEGNLSKDQGEELLEYLYKRRCRNCEHMNLDKPLNSRSCKKCKTPLPNVTSIPKMVEERADIKEKDNEELDELLDEARKITTHPVQIFAEDTAKAIGGLFKKLFK